MKIPSAFKKLAAHMHTDIDLVTSSFEHIPDQLIAGLNAEEKRVAKNYLKSTLATNPSPLALMSLWRSAGADAGPAEKEARWFFETLRDRL